MLTLTVTVSLVNLKYIGDNLTDQECDLIALTRFDFKLFNGEEELQQRCWFDYRYMHPVQRSYLFAHFYTNNFKANYRKYIDYEADHIIGISRPNDPLDNRPAVNKTAKLRTPTFLIKARQVADGMRIPYDFFTATGLKYVMRDRFYKALIGYSKSDKMRLHIQASAMYNDKTIEYIQAKWQEFCKGRITWSENPRLCFNEGEMNNQASPHPYKLSYERYLAKIILGRQVKEFALTSAQNKRFLRPSTADKIQSIARN